MDKNHEDTSSDDHNDLALQEDGKVFHEEEIEEVEEKTFLVNNFI